MLHFRIKWAALLMAQVITLLQKGEIMRYIITVTGASGVGKDTLVDALLCYNNVKTPSGVSKIAAKFWCEATKPHPSIRELVSHTTRAPRTGEKDGIDYHFASLEEFLHIDKIEETEYAGNHYCLAESELAAITDGGFGIVIVDQHGVDCISQFVDKHSDEYTLIPIFLTCTPELSASRMKQRGDSQESIDRRLAQQAMRNEYNPHDPDKYKYIFEITNKNELRDAVYLLQHDLMGKAFAKKLSEFVKRKIVSD